MSNWEQLNKTITEAGKDTTITLQDNLTNEVTITLYNDNIVITIDGNGKTINGAQRQVFNITSGSILILKNITITNAKSEFGGAIYNQGTLTITHSTLNNNTATRDGGAIENYGTLNITHTTLENNTANKGGAIRNSYGGKLSVSFSTLNGNNGLEDGGAISDFTDSHYYNHIVLFCSNFTENKEDKGYNL